MNPEQVERPATPIRQKKFKPSSRTPADCEKSGLVEIEDLKAQRLRAGLAAAADALEMARAINNSPVTDLSKNVSSLVQQLEEVVFTLRPLGEEV